MTRAQQDARPVQDIAPRSKRLDKKSQILDVASEFLQLKHFATCTLGELLGVDFETMGALLALAGRILGW